MPSKSGPEGPLFYPHQLAKSFGSESIIVRLAIQNKIQSLGIVMLATISLAVANAATDYNVRQPISGADVVVERSREKSKATGPSAETQTWSNKLRRAPSDTEPGKAIFESKRWTPPPAQVIKAEPTTPPFPFKYLGKIELGGDAITVYLTNNSQIYRLGVGDLLDGGFRVDEITATELTVTYVPLDKKQTMAFSSLVAPAATRFTGNTLSVAQMEDTPLPTSSSYTPSDPVLPTPATNSLPQGGAAASVAGPAVGGSAGTSANSTPSAASVITNQTTSGNSGAMEIKPPTIKEMPMSAPTISAMPILPVPSGSMQISAPTTSSMPLGPAGSSITTAPPPAAR